MPYSKMQIYIRFFRLVWLIDSILKFFELIRIINGILPSIYVSFLINIKINKWSK